MKFLLSETAGFLLWTALGIPPLSGAEAEHPGEGAGSKEKSQAENKLDAATLQSIRSEIDLMRAEYEKRIKDLEARLEQLQTQVLQGATEASAAAQPAQQAGDRTTQVIPGALNPAISAIGNFVGRGDSAKVFNEDGERIDNKLNLREGEIDMRVPVDPYADGVMIASLGSETPGRFSIDLEEAYVNIKKLPFLAASPLGLKIKVGRFRPAFGKTNLLHTHDLPQTFRPLPIEEFLGEEGFIQNGVSGNFFIPTPWDELSSLDVTVQAFNGGDLAISPGLRGRASYLGHLRWFRTFADKHNVELGWSSYFHPSGNEVRSANLHGLDFMYRWKPLRQGEWKSFLLGGEMMFTRARFAPMQEAATPGQTLDRSPAGNERPKGFTLFGQWQFNRRTYAGLRWDQTDTLIDPRLQRRSVTPYLSYYFSEFLRFRLNYEHRWSDLVKERSRNSVFAELNWVFGSHPPEPFWVNK